MAQQTAELSPQEFLQLAGHPVRWQLLGDLARSDRTVSELTDLAEQPQNLVSYHLGKLRDAELVSARRSSADGRDSYYTVDLARLGDLLSATGAAVHPALRLEPGPARPRPRMAKARVLFLCTGNSARSQMAEALTVARGDGRVAAHSAGSHPKPLHPHAVRVMQEDYGIDLAGHRPKHLDAFAKGRFDRVITLCDRVKEVCPELPGWSEPTHWSMPDPSADDGSLAAFRRTAVELDSRIGFLLATLTPQEDHR